MQTAETYVKSLDAKRRRAGGIYYTPRYIADYIVDKTVGDALSRCDSLEALLEIKICDPSCGGGIFLIAAFKRLTAWCAARGVVVDRRLAAAIQRSCLFGVDLDENAIRLTREALPMANLLVGNALKPREAFKSSKFDVVLGNPPYGAETHGGRKRETAELFMRRALELLSEDGVHSFIVPKAFLFSSKWDSIRREFMDRIKEIVDCGMVWPEVKLEAVIYVSSGRRAASARYSTAIREGERFQSLGSLDKRSFHEFGFILNGISEQELAVARKLLGSGVLLGQHARNRRGGALQSGLGDSGTMPVFGGKQITRYRIATAPKGYLSQSHRLAPYWYSANGAILAQNIVAHIKHPVPRLKISAALADKSIVILDTVNQLQSDGVYSPEFLLGVLNSSLISWYVYNFIVGRAVRTIHLDSPVTDRIPLPRRDHRHDELVALVKELLRDPSNESLDVRIDQLVCDLFGLGKGEARAIGVRGSGV